MGGKWTEGEGPWPNEVVRCGVGVGGRCGVGVKGEGVRGEMTSWSQERLKWLWMAVAGPPWSLSLQE